MALSEESSEVTAEHLFDRFTDYLEILLGSEAVEHRFGQLLAAAEHVYSVLPSALCHPQATWRHLLATHKHTRVLVEGRAARCQAAVRWINELTRHGPEVRVHVGLNGPSAQPVFVFDGQFSVVLLDRSDTDRTALLCKGVLAAAHRMLFEALWACSLRQASEGSAGLSVREVRIIGLLLAGATDEQAATRMGVSARTIRTVVARLQQGYGTNSRMALGFHLACSGGCADRALLFQPISAHRPGAHRPPRDSLS